MYISDVNGSIINLALCHKIKIDDNVQGDGANEEFHVVAEQVQFHEVQEHQLFIGTAQGCRDRMDTIGRLLEVKL